MYLFCAGLEQAEVEVHPVMSPSLETGRVFGAVARETQYAQLAFPGPSSRGSQPCLNTLPTQHNIVGPCTEKPEIEN